MEKMLKIIRVYDFKDYLENYLENIPKELTDVHYQDFTLEFWQNPSSDLTKLKAKYGIRSNVSVSSILMNNPIDEYYILLKTVWGGDFDLEGLIEKYKMTLSRIEQLIFPISYSAEDRFCPYCYGNVFEIWNKVRQKTITVKCECCGKALDSFIDAQEKESRIKEETDKKNRFTEDLIQVQQELGGIKCHQCQGGLILNASEKTMTYKIRCERCDSEYKSIDYAKDAYKQWQQKAAMMIRIKEKERELLLANLQSKNEDDIKIKSEGLITIEEGREAIKVLAKIQEQTNDIFKQLFNRYIRLSRLDRRVVTVICKECLHHGVTSTWTRGKEHLLDMCEVKYEEPLVYELMNKTKMIPIRAILRRLIAEGLVFCDEETAAISVHPSLVQNMKQLEAVDKPQNVNQQIAYIVFNKQRYVCYHCGENGRPLKIAYLTTDKNINDLSSLVGICDTCYHDVTEDEVIVDNIIALTNERAYELGEAWTFLLQYDNSFRESDIAQIEHENLYEEYDAVNLIKAYAIALDKKKRGDFIDEKAFWRYVQAILRNANGDVNVYPIIKERFKLDKWL